MICISGLRRLTTQICFRSRVWLPCHDCQRANQSRFTRIRRRSRTIADKKFQALVPRLQRATYGMHPLTDRKCRLRLPPNGCMLLVLRRVSNFCAEWLWQLAGRLDSRCYDAEEARATEMIARSWLFDPDCSILTVCGGKKLSSLPGQTVFLENEPLSQCWMCQSTRTGYLFRPSCRQTATFESWLTMSSRWRIRSSQGTLLQLEWSAFIGLRNRSDADVMNPSLKIVVWQGVVLSIDDV